nr:HAD-IA family hydrolase [Desulfobulbaceae bacterium]
MDKNNVLLFDCDGVLGDTERYGHLPAFNKMWAEKGVDWKWSVEQYGDKLKIGGGKERMLSLFADEDFLSIFKKPCNSVEIDEIIKSWHKSKTAIYKDIIFSGKVPARPGIPRLIKEAIDAGWTCAMCSTSAVESVEAVLVHAVGQDYAKRFAGIFAGDMVKAKKPAPDVYLLAVKELGIKPENCVVVEDSENGLKAAKAAQMKCLVTVNGYTKDENFGGASLVVSCLGDETEKCQVLANPFNLKIDNNIDLDIIKQIKKL